VWLDGQTDRQININNVEKDKKKKKMTEVWMDAEADR
jgi:hypothetical protein